MRQVPTYGVVGNGFAARHFLNYFRMLGFNVIHWFRQAKHLTFTYDLIKACDRVLLLISDESIIDFYHHHPFLSQKITVHFSGSLHFKRIFGAHPLYTFGPELYSLSKYKNIPFVVEHPGPGLKELLPGLDNPELKIPYDLKSVYHSLCVLGCNFSVLVWEKVFSDMEKKLSIPKWALIPILSQTFENLKTNTTSCLTGPLPRSDHQVLLSHLNVLRGDPFHKVYQACVNAYFLEKDEGLVNED